MTLMAVETFGEALKRIRESRKLSGAGLAYNEGALRHFGEFASLNDVGAA